MKVLLVKLSSLGDVVHTLPVVQDILAALPDAQIDWVVEQSFAALLSRAHGLGRVIPCEIRRWRKAPLAAATRAAWRAFRTDLQRDRYDAIIDMQGLTKSAVVARLARLSAGGKRYAMANQTDGSGYEAPTRWVADVAIGMAPHSHAVQRARDLAAQALGYRVPETLNYGLKVPVAQPLRLHDAIESIANKNSVMLVHGTSRADKEWPLAHWVALGQRLLAAGYSLALAHGSTQEQATSQAIAAALNSDKVRVLPLMGLDALADALAQCVGVVGVDSGVSHMAVALGAAHVQLYNFATAWRTGPVASDNAPKGTRQVSVFAQPTPSVQAVAQAWLGCTGVRL